MPRKIPLGVNIISIFIIITSILGIIASLSLIALGIASGFGLVAPLLLIIGIGLLLIALVKLVIAFKLRKGKNWARIVIIIIGILAIVLNIINLFGEEITTFTMITFSINILFDTIIVLYLLLSKKVRRFFR